MMRAHILFVGLILAVPSIAQAEAKAYKCSGNTVIKVGTRIGAQTPFEAVFSVDGDVATMVEGDAMRFAKTYQRSAELEQAAGPRHAFESSQGNLFLYKETGRFEIFNMQFVDGNLKSEETNGNCEKFTPNRVFD